MDLGGFFYKQAFYEYDGIDTAAIMYNLMDVDVSAIDRFGLYACPTSEFADSTSCPVYSEWIQAINKTTSFVAANLNYDLIKADPLMNMQVLCEHA